MVMAYWLGVIGTWILSDALYSYALYTGQRSQSWRGSPQTWAKDHYIRAIRAVLGLLLIGMGAS